MSLFKEWLLGIEEAQKSVRTPNVRPKKVKVPVVVHGDIDVWLKAVDGLAQDLQDLKSAKEKAKKKMDDIAAKAKTQKPEEPEQKKPETPEQKKPEKPEQKKVEKPEQKKPEKTAKPEKDQKSDKEGKKKSWLHPFKTAASRIGDLIKKWTGGKKTE